MSRYIIVTTDRINEIFKKRSRYYKTNLGHVNTIESKSGDRRLNESEPFARIYIQDGGGFIFSKGEIGDIRIFVDYHLNQDTLLFYYEKNKYVFEVDTELINKQGVDFYLGHLIKNIETEIEKKVAEIKIQEESKKGDPNKIFSNPGEVKYEDIAAYLEKQRLERLSVKK